MTGRGWHGESARHSLAARGIPSVLERTRPKMDTLIDASRESWQASSRTLSLYERNVEDMLVILETNLGPEDLQIKTTGGDVEADLARAREMYERSFYMSEQDRFVDLETAREYIHSALHALYEEYIL